MPKQAKSNKKAPSGRKIKRNPKAIARQRARALMSEPFIDDTPMDSSPPACTLADFQHPRLRRCPHGLNSTTFVGRVNSGLGLHSRASTKEDGGLDGYNWKVRFEDDSQIFVLKVLWDTSPPEPPQYYAAQRECQNAALFEMMDAALSKESAELGPILVRPRPDSREAGERNLFAFSDEARQQQESTDEEVAGDLVPLTEMPRMRRCFGWMRFTGEELLQSVPPRLQAPPVQLDKLIRTIDSDATYTAIVYEFVEEGENDPAAVQEVLNFLWCVGFSFGLINKADNWESSVLLDYSDIVHCNGHGWDEELFSNRTAAQVLR